MYDPSPQTNFNRQPLLFLAAYFAAGIFIGQFIGFWMAIAMTAVVSLLTLLVARQFAGFLVPVLVVPLGLICYQLDVNRIADDRIRTPYTDTTIRSGDPVELEGVLATEPELAQGGTFLVLNARSLTYRNSERQASGTVRLFAPFADDLIGQEFAQLDLHYGNRIRVMCRLLREEQFLNPGVRSRIAMLDEQGIDATATIKSPLLIEKLGSESVFLPLAWVHEARQYLIRSFREKLSPQTAGIMIASLLGDKHFLDRETGETFREGGTFHVLVISGLHITFIGAISFWVVSILTRRRSVRFVTVSTFLWAYTLAVGAEIPVVRATVMFTFLMFSHSIYRSGTLLNALGACTLVLLVWRPADLFTASFQLTFASVAAIVACAFPLIEKLRLIGSWTPTAKHPFPAAVSGPLKRFCECLYWNESAWRIENSRQVWSAGLFKSPYLKKVATTGVQLIAAYVFEGLLVSVIVQMFMLPLLIVYFHRVTPASLLLNLWVGLFLALESFAAVFAVLLSAVSDWLAGPLVILADLFNDLMMIVPERLSAMGVTGTRVPVYSEIASIVYPLYGVMVSVSAFALFRWQPFSLKRMRKCEIGLLSATTGLVACLAATIIFHPLSTPQSTGLLKIDFLDVGQGDSALVTFPSGETMLVDGGGRVDFRADESDFEPDRPRIGEAVVSEFLWEKGYSRIDYLVATHPDADHIEGLSDVARNFEIGKILVGTVDDPRMTELLEIAAARSIEVTIVIRGESIRLGEVDVRVLNPAAATGTSMSSNDASVVLRIALGQRVLLLTGDIESLAEVDLLASAIEELRADIVKVGHHGSRTSSTQAFVDAVEADVAVISVGRRSRFGHPHPEVVDRWRNPGVTLLTTGEKGTVTVTTDGREELSVATFVP